MVTCHKHYSCLKGQWRIKQWRKSHFRREYNWMFWICTSLLIIIRGLTGFRNKKSTQWSEFPNLNPKVMLTAIIPRTESAVSKNCLYIRPDQHQPSSSFLRPGSFVHFLWVGKRSNAASQDLVASQFPFKNVVALTFSCQGLCWTETSLLPDSNDCVCHSEQWGQIVVKMREKTMIFRAGLCLLMW